MAKCGIDTNAMMEDSEQPREHDKHIMDCCPTDREQKSVQMVRQDGGEVAQPTVR